MGLIVIEGATSVTISGLELSVPLVGFSPPSGSFSSLSQANQSLLSEFAAGLQIAIGIFAEACADLAVVDCTFELPDPGQANSFGAGIFATGTMTDLEITGCTFQSANAHWSSSELIKVSGTRARQSPCRPVLRLPFDSKLVAVGGAMGVSRCHGFGHLVGLGARCQALYLVGLTMGRGLTAFGPNENQNEACAAAKP